MEQQEIFIEMALHGWNLQITRCEQFLASLSDEDFLKEIARCTCACLPCSVGKCQGLIYGQV
jgi:hypothetical protein